MLSNEAISPSSPLSAGVGRSASASEMSSPRRRRARIRCVSTTTVRPLARAKASASREDSAPSGSPDLGHAEVHAQHRDLVGDNVVQVPGDTESFFGHPAGGFDLAGGDGGLGDFRQRPPVVLVDPERGTGRASGHGREQGSRSGDRAAAEPAHRHERRQEESRHDGSPGHRLLSPQGEREQH
jgi:hypothetical protein